MHPDAVRWELYHKGTIPLSAKEDAACERCRCMVRFFPLKERLDKTTLERLYHRAGLSYAEIAERYGTRSANVIKLMDEFGVPRRKRRSRRQRCGD
jgi:hypothetical protein